MDFYTQCWISNEYAPDRDGYPQVRYEGKNRRAHRVSFYLHNGYWPNVARHACDNPACYNPTHILDGTHADNMADMVRRGRSYNRNKDMPNQLTDKRAYDAERQRRIRAGTWVWGARVASQTGWVTRLNDSMPNPLSSRNAYVSERRKRILRKTWNYRKDTDQ